MSRYAPTRADMETVIRWDREDDQVRLWSASPVTWRRLARLGITATRETRARDGAVSGKFYTIPVARFRWGLKRAGGRVPQSPSTLQRIRQDASSGPSEGRG